MHSTKQRALEWAQADSLCAAPLEFADLSWTEVKADDLPKGLDYFVFDCANSLGWSVASQWLRHVLGLQASLLQGPLRSEELQYVNTFDPEVLISGIEMLWRRRIRSEVAEQKYTNHVNRVKHRALKLLSENEFANVS